MIRDICLAGGGILWSTPVSSGSWDAAFKIWSARSATRFAISEAWSFAIANLPWTTFGSGFASSVEV